MSDLNDVHLNMMVDGTNISGLLMSAETPHQLVERICTLDGNKLVTVLFALVVSGDIRMAAEDGEAGEEFEELLTRFDNLPWSNEGQQA